MARFSQKFSRELRDLAERVERSGHAAEETHDAVGRLADSLGVIASRMRRGERRLHLNSFVAYVLFTLLLGGGFLALYHQRASALEEQRDQAIAERDRSTSRLASLKEERAAREVAEASARRYLRRLTQDPAGALAAAPDLDRQSLSPIEREVLAERVRRARERLAGVALEAGREALEAGDHDLALTELRRALSYAGRGRRAAEIRDSLGEALARRGDYAEAAYHLELAVAGGEGAGADARYRLAQALDALGRTREAKAAYDAFVAESPKHELAWKASYRSRVIERDLTRAR